MKVEIREAYGELIQVKALLLEYVDWLGVDLRYQNFKKEFEELPKLYEKPKGRLYIAYWKGQAAGCVGLCPFEEGNCEMRRLYVRPAFRGEQIGQLLAERVIADAKEIGYDAILLDTLSTLDAARELYHKLGFVEIEPYYYNPIPDIQFYCLKL